MKIFRAFAIGAFYTFGVVAATAQDNKCEELFKRYEEQVMAYDYETAEPLLISLVKDCPKYDANIYLYGEKLYKVKIESAHADEDRQAALDSLMGLYADYEKNFPGNGSVVRKALLMKEQKLAKDDEVYKMLDTFYNTHKDKFTDYDALQEYFMLYLKQYEAKDKGISQKDFVNKYADIAAQASYAQNRLAARKSELLTKKESLPLSTEEKAELDNADAAVTSLGAVKENINILASKYFSCEILAEYYGNSYDEHKDDMAWLEAVATVMYDNKCYRENVLLNSATAIYKKRNDAASAYRMGEVLLKSGRAEEAIPYFEEAAVKETAPEVKAKRYYDIAVIYRNKDKARAKDFALRAANSNKEWGMPYLFLAEMYSSVTNDCGLNDFQRRALLFLATDMAQKAAMAENKYQPTAEALVKQYSEKYPSKSDAKAAGYKKGDEVKYGCWINETVKLPKL